MSARQLSYCQDTFRRYVAPLPTEYPDHILRTMMNGYHNGEVTDFWFVVFKKALNTFVEYRIDNVAAAMAGNDEEAMVARGLTAWLGGEPSEQVVAMAMSLLNAIRDIDGLFVNDTPAQKGGAQ